MWLKSIMKEIRHVLNVASRAPSSPDYEGPMPHVVDWYSESGEITKEQFDCILESLRDNSVQIDGGKFREELFLDAARAQTMLKDFDRLRKAIRIHDIEAAEAAWEKCERWIDQLRPVVRFAEWERRRTAP